MNIEFHYYILNYLCRRAGFPAEEARVISYASQFVDYNVVAYAVDAASSTYTTISTQNFGFWNVETPRNVYIPFHFFPGDPDYPDAERLDGRSNRLNCTPGSPGVKRLLIAALRSRDPYRLGVALHTYADSWAHQNFSGVREEWNVVDTASVIPPIGHAQALRAPDRLSEIWTDPRLVPARQRVVNRTRDLAAARKIYKYLCAFNRRPFDDAEAVLDRLASLLGPAGQEERILDLTIAEEMAPFDRAEWIAEAIVTDEIPDEEAAQGGYDKFLWLKDEVLYKSKLARRKPVPAKAGFFSSHFYRFMEAARAHREEALSVVGRDMHLAV